MVDMGIIIGGSPDTVRERLEAAGRENSIGNWVLLMQLGSMPKDLAMYNIDLFTEKVMPGLSDVFSNHQHHWWPKPIAGFSPAEVASVRREVRV